MDTALGGTLKSNLNLLRNDILLWYRSCKCVFMLLLGMRDLKFVFQNRIYIRNAICKSITGFEILRHFFLSYLQTKKSYTMCCLFMRFEEVIAITMKITVFWGVALCSLVDTNILKKYAALSSG